MVSNLANIESLIASTATESAASRCSSLPCRSSMATPLIHFTTAYSLSSHKPFPRLHHLHHDRRTKLLFTVSTDRFAVCAAAFRKTRGSKKPMSNVELCDEIKMFLNSTGLPHSHVPSVKDLSLHGRDNGSIMSIVDWNFERNRNDLANLVRRRGYKLIGELLATSMQLQSDGFYSRKTLTEKQLPVSGTEERLEDNVSRILNDNSDGERRFADAEFNVYESKVDIHGIQPKNLHGYVNTSLAMNQIASPTELGHILSNSRGKNLTGRQLADADPNNNVDAERNQSEIAEISHLKKMLPRKELELSRLEELIEKEQLALTALQDKAENELSNAKKLILDQDMELQAAEDFFSELIQVEIKYSGEGEMVEVAGSFNGWDQRIQLDPEQSPKSTEISPSSRGWSSELWLYPGTYEIKFVVDGEWTIDPKKETITRGSITNNILRADR